MMFRVNDEVETPRGPGLVYGQAPSGAIIVRMREQQTVPIIEMVASYNGWQFCFAEADLKRSETKQHVHKQPPKGRGSQLPQEGEVPQPESG